MANAKTGIIKKTENKAVKQDNGLKLLLSKMQGQIAKALPSVLTPERFTRIVTTVLSTNPDLRACTPDSFLGAVMQAAQLGLEPNTPLGQAYLIPYKNKGRMEATFQIGYQGLIDLAYRSGEISVIDAQAVHENDQFDYEYGLEPKLKFKPSLTNRGEVIAYYAMFKTKSGGYNFLVMSKEDVDKHKAQFSQSYGSSYSPWTHNYDSMAKKTVLKQVLKYAPKRSDFAKALSADGTIKLNIGEDMDDMPDEMELINVTPTQEEPKPAAAPVEMMEEPPEVPFDAD